MRASLTAFVAACLLVPLVSGCDVTRQSDEVVDDAVDRVNQARELWQAEGFENYAFAYRRNEGRGTYGFAVYVTGGRVDSTKRIQGTRVEDGPSGEDERVLTVDESFDEVERTLREAAQIVAQFDSELGYPVTVLVRLRDGTRQSFQTCALEADVTALDTAAEIQGTGC
jgi:hypothetical protein